MKNRVTVFTDYYRYYYQSEVTIQSFNRSQIPDEIVSPVGEGLDTTTFETIAVVSIVELLLLSLV